MRSWLRNAAIHAGCAAAVCAPYVAHAQSQKLVLYGVIDLSIAGINSQEQGTSISMQSGVQSGSRWGLRGTEDLGSGWRANFNLESGILATNGRSAQGGRLFGRAAWVGLSGPIGELRLGRQTSASSATLAEFDPFLASYLNTGAQTDLLPFNANRADNMVSYWTPSWNGWRVGTDYSFDYDGAGGFATDTSNKLASAAVVYEQDAYAITLTHERAHWAENTPQAQAMAAQGATRQPYSTTAAARVTWDALTLYAAWSWIRHGSTIPAVPSPGQQAYFPDSTVHGLLAGLTWRVGAGSVMASWQASVPQNDGALAAATATHHQQVYSLGYTHELSKRTGVYAIAGYLRGAWDDPSWHQTQYAVGLRHRF